MRKYSCVSARGISVCRIAALFVFFVVICLVSSLHANGAAAKDSLQVSESSSGQVDVSHANMEMYLGEVNEIPIGIQNGKVKDINVSLQFYSDDGFLLASEPVITTDIFYHSDGSTYIKIIPDRTGKVMVSLVVFFMDDSFKQASFESQVQIGSETPKELRIMTGQISGRLALHLKGLLSQEPLTTQAMYQYLDRPAYLTAKEVDYEVISGGHVEPVIDLDKDTGVVVARHLGHVLVKASFKGLTAWTCVSVERFDGGWHTLRR
ncbi:MAG TPA: hypothetical protein VG844_09220 [Terracidiphilus sp.]|nr:hypothetical protein [Terracidiphilus sp.]